MSAFGMSPSEIVEALVRRGVPRSVAEAQHGENGKRRQPPTIKQETRGTVALPITIVVPWSGLCSDDRRFAATMRSGKPLLVLSATYREAKAKVEAIARRAAGDRMAELGPVAIHADVYLPDRRRHDISNFCKLVHDALETRIYRDDNQIEDLRWRKAGIDVDSPRAVVVVSRAL